MKFGENLRTLRKMKGLTQEDLAEILNVSRQAISKWEYNDGYPEMDKMIELSEKLNISIDILLKGNINDDLKVEKNSTSQKDHKISITSYDGNIYLVNEVITSEILFPGRNEPKYLINVPNGSFFLGEKMTNILAYYRTLEDRNKEVEEIMKAISNGEEKYDLKYNTIYKPNLFNVNPITK